MPLSLNEKIPWDEGKHHEIGWILLIVLLTCGTLMNFLQIVVHIWVPKLWKLPNAPTILALAIQDFSFDLLCLITCTMSYHQNKFGGDGACLWQGLYAEFLMAWSGLSVCSLYYSCYANIVEGRSLSAKEVTRIQGWMALYCLLLTILGVVYPGTPLLNSAGLFCYTATQRLPEGIVFYIGYVTPLFGGLIYMNWKLESGLKKMKLTMNEYGLTIKPRPMQLDTLRSMRVYVAVMILCYSPVLSVSIYAWVTGHHQPASMWIVFGLSGHANTVLNPILYYLLSTPARKALFNTLHMIFGWSCLEEYEQCTTNPDQIAYAAYFDVLIRSPAGKDSLRREAEQNFSPELTRFYFDDYPAWLALCGKEKSPKMSPQLQTVSEGSEVEMGPLSLSPATATVTVSSPTMTPSTKFRELGDSGHVEMSQSQFEPLRVDDEKLDKMATYLYRTYIEEQSPLSLNIPDGLRQDIEDRLFGYGGTAIVASRDNDPSTIFVEVEHVVRELIFNNLYNSAFNSKEVREGFTAHQRVLESSRQGPL